MNRLGWTEICIKGLLILCVLLVLLVVASLFFGDGIPPCGVCGQKMYHNEVDYYITTFQQVGDVQVPQMTPVYKAMPHRCSLK
jgi:hypothetical protein